MHKELAIYQVWKYRSTDLGEVSLLIAGFDDSTVVANVLNSGIHGHQVVLPRSRFEGRTEYTVADPEPIEKDRKMVMGKKPTCYGHYLRDHPQAAAERECNTCLFFNRCVSGTPAPEPIEQGRKTDQDKLRWSLLPYGTIVQVLGVLEFGAKKYSVGNWAHVPDARTRYYDAAMRHLEAWWLGQEKDPESDLPHLAHAVCCLLFLMWFDVQVAERDEILTKLKKEMVDDQR